MIRIAYASTRELSAAALSQLPAEERAREFGSDERRRQFLCSRWLLRSLLSRFDGGSPVNYRIVTGEAGKPVCKDGPAISITHARDYVACCVSDSGEVGVDLEMIDARRRAGKVARRFFAAEESDWLEAQPPDRFFMLWVLKEAYGKATGRGVVDAFSGLHCIVEPPRIDVLQSGVASLALRLYQLHDSYLAVASTAGARCEAGVERWDGERGDFVVDDCAIEVARN